MIRCLQGCAPNSSCIATSSVSNCTTNSRSAPTAPSTSPPPPASPPAVFRRPERPPLPPLLTVAVAAVVVGTAEVSVRRRSQSRRARLQVLA